MRRARVSRALVAVALGVVLVLGLVAETLLDRRERLGASNTQAQVSRTATPVEAGGRYCANEFVPGEADRLRLFPGTRGRPGPAVVVDVTGPSPGMRSRGRHGPGYADGRPIEIALKGFRADDGTARICIENVGDTLVQFADDQETNLSIAAAAHVGNLGARPRIRTDFLLPGTPRNLEIADQVVARAALMKSSLVGSWTMWLLPLLMTGLVVLAVRALLRGARS